MVSRTWKPGTPIEHSVLGAPTLKCANTFTPGMPTHQLSSGCCFRCVLFLAPGSPEHQQNVLYRGHRLLGVRIYSHLEHQLISYQVNAVLGEYGFSHLEVRNTNRIFCTGGTDSQVCEYIHTWNVNSLVIKRMMFQVRITFHTWKNGLRLFRRTENVREEAFVMHRIYWGAPLVHETCFCVLS